MSISNLAFDVFVQLVISGLTMGALYALMAMGLVLLIRAVGVLNFAQGDLFMIGSYIGWCLTYQALLPPPLVWVGMLVIFVVMAAAFMFGVYWPMRETSWPTAVIICTIGASTIIKEGAMLIWGSIPLPFEPLIDGSVQIGAIRFGIQFLIIIAVAAVLITGVFLLFEKLYAGRVMQAATQNKYAAEILGIPTLLTTFATYIIIMIIAGTGGYLVAPILYTSTSLSAFQTRAFAGVIVGGWGDLKGAVIGSLIVGLVESLSSIVTTAYKDSIVFLLLLVVLVLRPQGIFGSRIYAEKA